MPRGDGQARVARHSGATGTWPTPSPLLPDIRRPCPGLQQHGTPTHDAFYSALARSYFLEGDGGERPR